jgi:N-glycosylase/DNA lyase
MATIRLDAPLFSLHETLDCGQAFRWRPAPDGWYGFIANAAVKVSQAGPRLIVHTADTTLTPADVRHYFALDVDLPRVLAAIDVDAQIHGAIDRFPGLRVLHQDSWECLASFILSSFNNIKRIQGMIERVCEAYGEPAAFNGFRGSTFPSPETLARVPERRLRELGLGYRAPYLLETARMVAEGRMSLQVLRQTDYRTTKAALLNCPGVGEKVGDCVALFGFEKYEAFPIDVWMERAMRYYFRSSRLTPLRMREFAERHFGQYAGYAQQYLYHYIRTARRPLPTASGEAARLSTAPVLA